jgi:hypothetical protein
MLSRRAANRKRKSGRANNPVHPEIPSAQNIRRPEAGRPEHPPDIKKTPRVSCADNAHLQ